MAIIIYSVQTSVIVRKSGYVIQHHLREHGDSVSVLTIYGLFECLQFLMLLSDAVVSAVER